MVMEMQTQTKARLAPAVRAAVDAVVVAPDRTSATVQGRPVEADTPRELRRLLAESLYNTFHSGQPDGPVPTRLRDPALEQRFVACLPHERITTRARACGGPEADPRGGNRVLVEREGVRFWAPVDLLDPAEPAAGDIVALRMPSHRAALSPGFFLVDGSRPRRGGRDVRRVYINVTGVDDAVRVWGHVLAFLEGRQVPYRAKVLSARELYPRRDAVVVYLDGPDEHLATELADLVAGAPGVGPEVSAFVRRLGPGVGTAWEPTDNHPGRQGLSFGQHRATVLAAALVDAAGDDAVDHVVTAFEEAGIDPTDPSRNRQP
jgi:hypothetical protein